MKNENKEKIMKNENKEKIMNFILKLITYPMSNGLNGTFSLDYTLGIQHKTKTYTISQRQSDGNFICVMNLENSLLYDYVDVDTMSVGSNGVPLIIVYDSKYIRDEEYKEGDLSFTNSYLYTQNQLKIIIESYNNNIVTFDDMYKPK